MTFHRVERERCTTGGIPFRVSLCAPHASTPPHAHERAFVCLILDGSSTQRAGARDFLRERGRAYFYPAGEVQSERFGATGGRIFAFDLPSGPNDLPSVACELRGRPALFARRFHTDEDDESALSLVGALSHEFDDGVRWMEIARDYLHAHFAEKLSLQRIAGAAGVHPVHLCRAFPRRFGVGVGDYLRALRVDHAARQLVATRLPIAEIALDAGFDSQSHLTRHFRARLGITPAAYRAGC